MLDTVSGTNVFTEIGAPNSFYAGEPNQNQMKRLLEGRPNFSIGNDVRNSLGQYGVGDSKYDDDITSVNVQNLQNIRAQRQSPMAQFGNMLGQAIIGEIAGGMIEGTGYLFNIGEFNRLIEEGDDEFGNQFSRAGTRLKEFAKERCPYMNMIIGKANLDRGTGLGG